MKNFMFKKINNQFNKTINSSQYKCTRNRLLYVTCIFMLCILAINYKLAQISLFNNSEEINSSNSNSGSLLQIRRASIIDRNGVLLATNLITSSLYANAKQIDNPTNVAKKLAKILPNLDEKQLLDKLNSKKSFVWIARHLTPIQHSKVFRIGEPGLYFIRDEKRVYPKGELTSHVLGFTDIDNKGISGLEKSMDSKLRKDSTSVQISMDVRIQHILHSEVKRAVDKFNAKGGNAIVMNVKNGEVLAMVSLPDFDPNKLAEINSNNLFNRNTLGLYEMGSTLKIINTAMAFETGVANLKSEYDATKPLRIGRFYIKDYCPKNRKLNVPEIFVYSSNIGAAKMALDVGANRQKDFLHNLKLLESIKLEVPEVSNPVYPKNWRKSNIATISYGYGISITPIHLMRAVSSILNEGILVEPTLLIKDIKQELGKEKRVISSETSKKIRTLMRLVIKHGTGKKADVSGYIVLGKTGTANKDARGKYDRKKVRTSFIGTFGTQFQESEFMLFIMLDEPKALKETFGFNAAGWNAAPVARRIISRIAPVLGVKPVIKNKKDTEKKFLYKIQNANYIRKRNIVE